MRRFGEYVQTVHLMFKFDFRCPALGALMVDYSCTDTFRGATFRDCDLRDVRLVSSFVDGLVIRGFSGRAGPQCPRASSCEAFPSPRARF